LRVLALDYGTARCGCAISDPTGTLVTPLPAVEPPDVARIAELVSERGVEGVVVGLPTTLGGEEGAQAQLTRAFVEELAGLLDVPVETYDERLTTTMAERSARQGARADTDSLAAAHLLESYLTSRGEDQGAPGVEREQGGSVDDASRRSERGSDGQEEAPSDE
jgi:putative holliday junction resolvase